MAEPAAVALAPTFSSNRSERGKARLLRRACRWEAPPRSLDGASG